MSAQSGVQHGNGVRCYPTARDIVHAALTAPDTYTNDAPSQSAPNYAIPCTDLDGNPHQLVVVPLGERVALVGLGGDVVVLQDNDVGTLAGSLEDTLVITVPGGKVRIGKIDIKTDHDLRLQDNATLSVEAHPYDTTASIRLEAMSWRVTWPANAATLRTLGELC